MNLKVVHFLIVLLNLLDEKTKYRFAEYLDHRLADRALHKMIATGRFPKWFMTAFYFDPFYGTLYGLRECLSTASANGLLRMDGTRFNYHPELSKTVISYLVGEIGIDRKEVQALAHELNRELDRLLSEKRTRS